LSKPARETHRDALLSAAKTLMRQSGRGDITARDLVAASNTNLGSISYHFGSKDALLDEAAKRQRWPDAAIVDRPGRAPTSGQLMLALGRAFKASPRSAAKRKARPQPKSPS
jgi:AcrR family transcriptional regulator